MPFIPWEDIERELNQRNVPEPVRVQMKMDWFKDFIENDPTVRQQIGDQGIQQFKQEFFASDPVPLRQELVQGQDDRTILEKALGVLGDIVGKPLTVQKRGLSPEARAQATVELQARQEGIPVEEYREATKFEALPQAFVEEIPGVMALQRAATGIQPWEYTSKTARALEKLGHAGGFFLTAMGVPSPTKLPVIGKIISKISSPISLEKAASKLAEAGLSKADILSKLTEKALTRRIPEEAAHLGMASTIASLNQILESKDATEAAKKMAHTAKSGAITGAIFGTLGKMFPTSASQRPGRVLTGLLALEAQHILEDPKHRMFWKRGDPLDLITDTAMSLFFLWNGGGEAALAEADQVLNSVNGKPVERVFSDYAKGKISTNDLLNLDKRHRQLEFSGPYQKYKDIVEMVESEPSIEGKLRIIDTMLERSDQVKAYGLEPALEELRSSIEEGVPRDKAKEPPQYVKKPELKSSKKVAKELEDAVVETTKDVTKPPEEAGKTALSQREQAQQAVSAEEVSPEVAGVRRIVEEMVKERPEGAITKKDGTPFKTKAAVQSLITKEGLTRDYEPMEVEGGWIARPIEPQRGGEPRATRLREDEGRVLPPETTSMEETKQVKTSTTEGTTATAEERPAEGGKNLEQSTPEQPSREREITPQLDKLRSSLNPLQVKVIDKRVQELGSVEAVKKQYRDDTDSGRYAIALAEQLYGKEPQLQPSQPQEIRTKAGKPFKTKGALVLQLKRRGLVDTHEPVQVEGGWVARPKKKYVEKEIDNILNKGKERMQQADPSLRGLKPTEYEWLTKEEQQRVEKLKQLLPTMAEERVIAQQRIKEKREARKKELEKQVEKETKTTSNWSDKSLTPEQIQALDRIREAWKDGKLPQRPVFYKLTPKDNRVFVERQDGKLIDIYPDGQSRKVYTAEETRTLFDKHAKTLETIQHVEDIKKETAQAEQREKKIQKAKKQVEGIYTDKVSQRRYKYQDDKWYYWDGEKFVRRGQRGKKWLPTASELDEMRLNGRLEKVPAQELKQPPHPTEYPFGKISADEEDKFYGSKVRVYGATGATKPYEGTVNRVLNGGRLIEVKPDGSDSIFRIEGRNVEVLSKKEKAGGERVEPKKGKEPWKMTLEEYKQYLETKTKFAPDEYIEASRIEPPHEVRDVDKKDNIRKSMKKKGWVGRPLLVVKGPNGLQALTGSHRLAVAKELDIDVPVIKINQKALEKYLSETDQTLDEFNTDRDVIERELPEIDERAAKLFSHEVDIEDAKYSHEAEIERAVKENKPVPRHVLEEYKGEPWADEALKELSEAKITPKEVKEEEEKAKEKKLPTPATSRPKAKMTQDQIEVINGAIDLHKYYLNRGGETLLHLEEAAKEGIIPKELVKPILDRIVQLERQGKLGETGAEWRYSVKKVREYFNDILAEKGFEAATTSKEEAKQKKAESPQEDRYIVTSKGLKPGKLGVRDNRTGEYVEILGARKKKNIEKNRIKLQKLADDLNAGRKKYIQVGHRLEDNWPDKQLVTIPQEKKPPTGKTTIEKVDIPLVREKSPTYPDVYTTYDEVFKAKPDVVIVRRRIVHDPSKPDLKKYYEYLTYEKEGDKWVLQKGVGRTRTDALRNFEHFDGKELDIKAIEKKILEREQPEQQLPTAQKAEEKQRLQQLQQQIEPYTPEAKVKKPGISQIGLGKRDFQWFLGKTKDGKKIYISKAVLDVSEPRYLQAKQIKEPEGSTTPIVDTEVFKDWTKPVEPIAVHRNFEGIEKKGDVLYFDVDGKLIAVYKPYIDYFRHKYGKIELKINPQKDPVSSPLAIYHNDKFVGVVMPLYSKGGGIFPTIGEVKSIIKEQSDVKRFSISNKTTGKHLAKPFVEFIVKKASAKWKEIPEITVVEKQADLPKDIQRPEIIIKGAYYKDKVYLVAENFTSQKDVVKTLTEEVIGHAGLRKALDSKLYNRILDALWGKHQEDILPVARDYKLDITNPEQRRIATDEWIAKQIADDSLPKRIWQRLVFAVKAFMRKLGYSGNFTLNEIKGMLRAGVIKGYSRRINEFAVPVRYSLKEAIKKITDNPNFRKWFGKSKVVDENGEPLVVYHGTPYGNFAERAAKINKYRNLIKSKIEKLKTKYEEDTKAFWDLYRDWQKEAEKKYGSLYYLKPEVMLERQALSELEKESEKLLKPIVKLQRKLPPKQPEGDVFHFVRTNDYGYLGSGFYFTANKDLATQYAQFAARPPLAGEKKKPYVYEVFLSIQRPFREGKDEFTDEMVKYQNELISDYEAGRRRISPEERLEIWAKTKTKTLRHFGYDGIIGESAGEEGIEYVVFSPTQIKSIYNRGTFDPNNPDIRYSLGETKSMDEVTEDEVKPYLKPKDKLHTTTLAKTAKKASSTIEVIPQKVQEVFAPAEVSERAGEIAYRLRRARGKTYEVVTRLEQQLKTAQDIIDRLPKEVIDKAQYLYETGNADKIKDPTLHRFFAEILPELDKVSLHFINQIQKLLGRKAIEGLSNYLAHLYKDPQKATSVLSDILSGKTRIEAGGQQFLKHRVVPTYAEAEALGLERRFKNPIDTTLYHMEAVMRWAETMRMFKELKDDDLIKFFRVGKKGTEAKLQHPDWVRLKDPTFTALFPTEKGVVVAGSYYAPPDVARILNNASSRGMADFKTFQALRSATNFVNMLNMSMSIFHGSFSAVTNGMNYLAMALADLPRLRLKSAARNLARAALSAPIPIQTIRDVIEGKRMIDASEYTPIVKFYMRSGGKIGLDPLYDITYTRPERLLKQAMAEGRLKGLRNPALLLSAVLDKLNTPIMRIMVPALKVRAFEELFMHEMSRKNIDMPLDEFMKTKEGEKLAQHVVDLVEDRFGQMNYDNLHWNRFLKHGLQLALRTVGWNYGDIREVMGAGTSIASAMKELAKGNFEGAKGKITQRVFFTMAVPLMHMYISGLLTYLLTGERPEGKDWVAPRSKTGERYSIPSYFRDWMAVKYQGIPTTIKHKLNPIWNIVADQITNTDYWGTKLTRRDDPVLQQLWDRIKHVGDQLLPFSVQSLERTRSGKGKVLSMAGLTKAPTYITRTPTQRLIFELYEEEHHGQIKTKSEAEAQRFKAKIRQKYQETGKIPYDMVNEAEKKGYLPSRLSRTMFIRSLPTEGWQRAFRGLSAESQLEVLKQATEEERLKLWKYAKRMAKIMYNKWKTRRNNKYSLSKISSTVRR